MVTTRRVANTGPGAMADTNATRTKVPRTSAATPRTPAHLPTPLERLALALFPVILVFGTVFSVLSPQTRASAYDPVAQAHAQDPSAAPSYFARKSNIFNVVFVKRGWGWTTFAFVFFLLTHPSGGGAGFDLTPRRLRAGLRWAVMTAWWFFVTQWCFGPPIIDRGFRWTGGRCELAEREVAMDPVEAGVGEMLTAVACKASGGRWKGGHDISGHVFLLVLGTAFLMHEVGWAVLRWSRGQREERCVVMPDGALKSANVEAETPAGQGEGDFALGVGGKTALAIMGLNLWMLLMTAIYFHTWFEKVSQHNTSRCIFLALRLTHSQFTGLVTALVGVYVVYVVPRFVPALRGIVGLPGV